MKRNNGPQIQVLTVKSLQGLTIEDFSIEVVDKWQLGDKERDDGLLLLVSTGNKKVRIEVGDGLEGDMTDYRSGEIIDEMIKSFKKGQMDVGIFIGVSEILSTLGVDTKKLKVDQFISSRNKRTRKKSSIFDMIANLSSFYFSSSVNPDEVGLALSQVAEVTPEEVFLVEDPPGEVAAVASLAVALLVAGKE